MTMCDQPNPTRVVVGPSPFLSIPPALGGTHLLTRDGRMAVTTVFSSGFVLRARSRCRASGASGRRAGLSSTTRGDLGSRRECRSSARARLYFSSEGTVGNPARAAKRLARE